MNDLRVCMTTTYFYPVAGGAEKQVERLSAWLVKHGVPVMIVTRRVDDSPTHEVMYGAHVYRIPVPRNKILASLAFTVRGLLLLIKHRREYNVVHSHQIYSPTTLGWIASRLFGYPLVVNLHLGGTEGDITRLLRRKGIGQVRLNLLKQTARVEVMRRQKITV